MAGVEQEMWNIFTFYTLHGNPLDPEHLRATQFVKFARDCELVGATGISEADINVAYTAEIAKKDRGSVKRMNYNDFLTALMKISTKIYPDEKTYDSAFQKLLMNHVLSLASRRCPENVDAYLGNEEVNKLFVVFADALEQIFQFYATQSDLKIKKLQAKSPIKSRRSNTMKDALGYNEFLKFASDFDLSNSVILSTLELGDIYLSSIKPVDGDTTIRKLTFVEFWEAIVRAALVAYSKISTATVVDKIKGLFLYMWRRINQSVPRAFNERRNVSTYAGDLLAGAMLFNKRFTAQWAADNYKDYLAPEEPELPKGLDVLKRVSLAITGEAGGGAGAGAGTGRSFGKLGDVSADYDEDMRLPPPPPGGMYGDSSMLSGGGGGGGGGSGVYSPRFR